MDESTLFKIVEEATGADAGSVSLDTTAADIEGWDSLGHLTIISAISEHLGDDVEEDPRLASADSVKELVDILL